VLDRAVTLCVRHFVPLSLIYVVYAVPLAIVSYFASSSFQSMLLTISDAMKHGATPGAAATGAEIARELGRGGGFNGWTAALLVMTFVLAPLPAAALIEATASTYLGRMPTFAEAYRVGLARWLPLIGVNLLYIAAAAVLYIVCIIVLALIVLALAFLTSTLHAVGVAIDVIVGLAFGIAGIGFGIVVGLALQVSYFTCVVERENAAVAFTRGVSRVFARVGLKRSLLIGVAFIAIGIAIGVISLIGQEILVGMLRSGIAGTAYAAILRVATAAFTTAYIGIFYFDLRVREEGLDLTLEAQSTLGAHPGSDAIATP